MVPYKIHVYDSYTYLATYCMFIYIKDIVLKLDFSITKNAVINAHITSYTSRTLTRKLYTVFAQAHYETVNWLVVDDFLIDLIILFFIGLRVIDWYMLNAKYFLSELWRLLVAEILPEMK